MGVLGPLRAVGSVDRVRDCIPGASVGVVIRKGDLEADMAVVMRQLARGDVTARQVNGQMMILRLDLRTVRIRASKHALDPVSAVGPVDRVCGRVPGAGEGVVIREVDLDAADEQLAVGDWTIRQMDPCTSIFPLLVN